MVAKFEPSKKTPIGVTFPGVVQHGIVKTAANVDSSWIGTNLRRVIRDYAGHDVHVLNDADAAGYAEFLYGAAHKRPGVVLMTTLGTGIGTALIVDGVLVPNTELGHISIDGVDAEENAAESARERHNLPTSNGSQICSATTRRWRNCCGRTSSSWVAASRRSSSHSCRSCA